MVQTRSDRIRYHLTKKTTSFAHGLRPSGIIGRFKGPKILINSIPKAGTHLVERALENYPLLRNAAQRTLRGWSSADPRMLRVLSNTCRGLFRTGHLPAHGDILHVVREKDIRVLFVLRDPRDIVVSNFKYATYLDLSHPTHAYFKSLPDDETRLLKTIVGEPEVLTPIAEILDLFEPWLDPAIALSIRFEDLVGSRGGGEDGQQMASLRKIADFLKIKITDDMLTRIAGKVFHTKSLTFHGGQIGKWRTVFSPAHLTTFRERVGDRLEKYGYSYDA